MIYLSATYFAKYHADLDTIEQQLRAIVVAWGSKTRVWQSSDKTQVNIDWSVETWSVETAPEDVYMYLGAALDVVLLALRDCPPDMASAQIRKGERSYNTYVVWHSDRQAELETDTMAVRDGMEIKER